MTILESERLVRKISGLSREASGLSIAPKLAEDYAGACHAANLRLQQCEAMIREGARHQAIQAAETAPNLLDWIAVLEFQGVEEWKEYCEKNGLTAAERIDARSVAALNECYAQGISTDHPLYAAYRRAVLTHNDEEALKALQSIVRLNPSDANAASELERFDGKVLAAKLQNLGDLVSGATPDIVIAQVEAIEGFGFKTQPTGDAWRKAQTVRCAGLIEEAARLKSSSLWLDCFVKLDSIRRLQESFGVQLPPDALAKLEALETWAHGEQAKEKGERDFQSRVAELRHHLQGDAASLQSASLATLREDSAGLQQAWDRLKSSAQPIPETLANGFQKRSAELAAEISRRLGARRRKTAIGFAVGAAAVVIVLGIALVEFRARELAKQLNQAVADRQAATAETLLASARHGIGNQFGMGGLPAAVTAAEDFVSHEHSALKDFQDAFAQLPKELSGDPPAAAVSKISSQLARTRTALAALGADDKAANEPQLNAFEQRWNKYLSASTAPVNDLFERSVAAAEKQYDRLNYNLTIEEARSHSATLSNQLSQISDYESGFTNHLTIRAGLLERSASVRSKFATYQGELGKLDDALASLRKGRDINDYSNALDSIASSRFSSSSLAKAATVVRDLKPDDQSVLRVLLGATNDASWDYVKQDKAPSFVPDRMLPAERELFDHLSDDPSVNADHQLVRLVLDGAGGKAIEWITTGPLARAPEWKNIAAYDPSSSPNICTFESRQYGFFDGKYKWSPALSQTVVEIQVVTNLDDTAAFHSVGLQRAFGTTHHDQPLLAVLDALKDSRDGSPVFRAYLFQQVVGIMKLQPAQRGLTFAPSIEAHSAQIKSVAGGNPGDGDWFVAARVNATAAKLDGFFDSIKGVSYKKQASEILKLDHETYKNGLRYVGFVEVDGKAKVVDHSSTGEIWGYRAADSQPGLVGRTTDNGASLSVAALPLSPLFVLAKPRNLLLDTVGVNATDPAFAGGLPPLFRAQP